MEVFHNFLNSLADARVVPYHRNGICSLDTNQIPASPTSEPIPQMIKHSVHLTGFSMPNIKESILQALIM
jgi:hypothetical protein